MVQIALYKPEYKNDFIRLNKEWIETYFTIEASDIETFTHVDDIIEQGGQIFIALHDGEVVGCCALKYHDEKQSYELAKMAVSPHHQGKHIGYLLGKTVLQYAQHHGIKRIFLEGNTHLKASIALYRKLGFAEIPLKGNAYERCDILMEWKNKMNIHQIIFSPTGGTRRVSEILCHGMGVESVVTDLCVKSGDIQLPDIHEDDLAVIAMPVYAGRVPALAVERLRMVKPNGAKCVVVAVFGNRAYDDALLEMQDVASEMGFRVIAAVAAVAEHSIIRKYGKGRPDDDDEQKLRQFGADIINKAERDDCTMPQVPGNRPYKKGGKVPHPKGRRGCNRCGVCAKQCPADAIPLSDPKTVDSDKCISCMKCVSVCPTGARGIGMIMNFLATQGLKKVCATRKENELYI